MIQARLRDRHQELLRKKLFFLKQQQLTQDGVEEGPPLFPSGAEEKGKGPEREEGGTAGPSGTVEEHDILIDEHDLLKRAHEDYESGGYSPKLLKPGDIEEVSLSFSWQWLIWQCGLSINLMGIKFGEN